MPIQIQFYWDLVEPVFSFISLDGLDTFESSIKALPRSAVLLYSAHLCLSEVHNGGFLQFFWNSTGLIAPEAIEGFEVIGMPDLANVVTTAAGLLESPYPRDRNARWDALLAASGRDEAAFERICREEQNFYLAFCKATETLPFDSLNRQAWDLANKEAGGFQEAATRYARKCADADPALR